MKTFFCKLTPPRPTFAADMSELEGKLMQEHAAYWNSSLEKGRAIVFGLVNHPKGAYGIGIVEVEDRTEVARFVLNDPVIKANLGFTYDVYAMPRAVSRP
jgi:uncharacterized protein